MISRVTIFSLLLGLMLAMGLWLRDTQQTDNCSRYMAGDKSLPASEYVVSGSRTVEVSCNDWLARQPVWVQVLCLVELTLGVVFVLNALLDFSRLLESRRRFRSVS
jgi:hypothetical protein